MSALDNLSAASSVLQLIGFADTVFRAGKNLYDLFDKARSASRNIASLLLELQALLSIVAFVHVVISEHASSPFAQDDGHMLPNIHTILTLIGQDFRHLIGILEQTANSGREGWSSLFVSLRWALKDHEIAAPRYRLAQYTQNLTAALSALGRRNDIALRTKLQSIDDKLQIISQSKLLQSRDPEDNMRPARSRSTFPVPRRQSRARCTAIQPRGNHQSSLVKADITPTRLNRREDSVMTPGTVNYKGPGCPFTKCVYPKFNIYEDADRRIFLDSGNYTLHKITKPAMLLRDSLISSFDAMRINRVLRVSEAQIEHLQGLFEFFVASAHTASAEAIMNKYGNTSGNKLLDRGFLGRIREDTERLGIGSSVIVNGSLSTYLEAINMILDTKFGSVKGTILSARSYANSITLASTFEYLGDKSRSLSPFAVQFMTHKIESYSRLQPCIEQPCTECFSVDFTKTTSSFECHCLCSTTCQGIYVAQALIQGWLIEMQFNLKTCEDTGPPRTRVQVNVKLPGPFRLVAKALFEAVFTCMIDQSTRLSSPPCTDDDSIRDYESTEAPGPFDDEELQILVDFDLQRSLTHISCLAGGLPRGFGPDLSISDPSRLVEYIFKFFMFVIYSLTRWRYLFRPVL